MTQSNHFLFVFFALIKLYIDGNMKDLALNMNCLIINCVGHFLTSFGTIIKYQFAQNII